MSEKRIGATKSERNVIADSKHWWVYCALHREQNRVLLVVANHKDAYPGFCPTPVDQIPLRQGPFGSDLEALTVARFIPLEAGRLPVWGAITVRTINWRGVALHQRLARWREDFPLDDNAYRYTNGIWPERVAQIRPYGESGGRQK